MSEGPIDILRKMARNQDARARSDLESTNFASDLEIGERMVLPPRARGLRVKFSEIQLIDMNRTHKHGKDVDLDSFSEGSSTRKIVR